MEIRAATESDLPTILALGRQFGHQMLYQKDEDCMRSYLNRIVVAEDWYPGGPKEEVGPEIVGFYHYILSSDDGFSEMLRCYRQMSDRMIRKALDVETNRRPWIPPILVCMQGGSHREIFREFIDWFKMSYDQIWCYTSIKSEGRTQSYKDLGFEFDKEDRHLFFNIHKGAPSTYQLGIYKKDGWS